MMSRAEVLALAQCSESTLRRHQCAWCGQDLYRALRWGCCAVHDRCDPKDRPWPWAEWKRVQKEGGAKDDR